MKKHVVVAFAATLLLTACSAPLPGADDPVVQNLTYVIAPTSETVSAQRNALAIMSCAVDQARAKWSPSDLKTFSGALGLHARKVQEHNVALANLKSAEFETALAGGLALVAPSPTLRQYLTRFAPLVSSCESQIGGQGVEF